MRKQITSPASTRTSPVAAIPFRSYTPERPINHVKVKRFARIHNPHSLLLVNALTSSHGAQDDATLRALHLQNIAGTQSQFIPDRLRQHDTTGVSDFECGNHNGILPCHSAFNAIINSGRCFEVVIPKPRVLTSWARDLA
jgi:hypothetical protein